MIHAASPDVITSMGWKGCALLVGSAGAVGGVLNAYFTDHGLKRPTVMAGIWCPGAIGNIIVGAVSAIVSWALYGSGAGVDIAIASASARELISLRLSALAGALLVGIAGARWLSSAVDKALLDESVRQVARTPLSPERKEELQHCDTPIKVLKAVARA
jgi:membrane associated rhomboid family serine protease